MMNWEYTINFYKYSDLDLSWTRKFCRRACRSPALQFSTSVEVRVGIPSVVRLFVRYQYSRRTALRIFLIFCMNVPYHKGKKRTRPFVREKSGSLIIHENVSKIMVFGHFFRDYWWDLPKNAHEYSLDGSLWPCIGCWVSRSLEVRYFAYWLSQYA